MADLYRIFGAEMSPYSVKVHSYFRYKAIPHQWILRNAASRADYEKHAKVPIIPLVVTPQGIGIQDSTPIIDQMEKLYPEPSIHPEDNVARFVSVLIEEFGDEWGNKWMFHYRWNRDVDQISSAGRIARMQAPHAGEQDHAGLTQMLALLEEHLASRPYLFGARPAYGDFGLWGQFYQMWRDPTAGALIEGDAPHVLDWIHRMLFPRADGPFEGWATLQSTLAPILKAQVGGKFMPWTLANEKCLAEGKDEFTVQLGGETWTQKPQKYHARALAMLRTKYAEVSDKAVLEPVLREAGCLDGLRT